MPDLSRPPSSVEPASPQPAGGRNAVPGAAPTGSASLSEVYRSRCLAQMSYLSGRLAGLAGTNRYALPNALRDELGMLAAIAEQTYVLTEGIEV